MSTAVDNQYVKGLEAHLATINTDVEGMSSEWKDETGNGNYVVAPEAAAKYLKRVQEGQEVKALLIAAKGADDIRQYMNAPAGPSGAGIDAGAGLTPQIKALSDEFFDSEMYAEMKSSDFRRLGNGMALSRGIGALSRASQVKDVYSAMGGTLPNMPTLGTAQNLGFTERTLRPGRVRDLFPSESTQAAILYGIRETGYTNRAGVVPERTAANGGPATGGVTDVYGLKPKSDLSIVPVTYPIATIAHIMYVHRQTLEDEPRMRGILDRDMVDGVKMAEDEQLLWGNGVGDNLTGLMNTQGIQRYTGLATDKRSAQVRRAATRAILAYFNPTGCVLHPFDFEEMELETDKQGAYTVAVSVAIGAEKRLWRLNVADSPAMRQGRVLVGAMGTGAKVYDRESVNVALSTENRDLFERNAYTLRAEERVGLVVDRPESFVDLTLTTPTVAA